MSSKHYIPEGWKRLSLHQLALIQTGVAKGKKDIKNPIQCPYLRVANVQDGHLDLTEIKIISIASNELSRYSLRRGDVLMTEGGDFDKLGRGFVWEEQIQGCLHQNHVFAVRPDPDKLDSFFLSYQAGSSYGKGYFVSCSKQSTNLASINSSQLKEFPVLLPSLREQKAIVQIVQIWDRSIDHTERLIAAKQERRTWLMQQLLTGKRRLPGFDGEWREVHIRDIFKPVRRKNDKGVTHVLTASGEHGLVDQTEYFNRSVSGESLDGYYLLHRGEFAYNRSSMNGYPYGAIKRLDAYDEGVLSTLYLCFKLTSDHCHSDFFKHLFEAGVLNIQLRKVVQVGARAHGLLNVTLQDFFSLKVSCPPIEEQKRIATTIDVADRELDLLRTQLDALREQKKGLMQQLLTGKIRVKV